MSKHPSAATLRQQFLELKNNYPVAGLKTGTEIEDMGFAEISEMHEICRPASLTVKIGGPEARRDMRESLAIGVDVILAPMVETEYALSNFVAAFDEICSEVHHVHKIPKLAINLETSTAMQNLDTMIRSSAFQRLSQVTIGRGDLSKSMNLGVDDNEVIAITASALKKIKNAGKLTSVGGGWNVASVAATSSKFNSTTINTRHVALENNSAFQKNAEDSLYAALVFEVKLYDYFAIRFPERKTFYLSRKKVLAQRLGLHELQQHKPA